MPDYVAGACYWYGSGVALSRARQIANLHWFMHGCMCLYDEIESSTRTTPWGVVANIHMHN